MVDVKKHHKFFFGKFHRRNFDARRIFDENVIFGLFEKCPKMTPDVEKSNILAISGPIRPISWKLPKMVQRHLI